MVMNQEVILKWRKKLLCSLVDLGSDYISHT